ncbi:hypothetical protein [Dactylosporangium sp. NPDC000521]|uniref:hypothetical protein n=1 Tax=Dactylosporangium sp. NPDC000521 TaxID=3363975 RepID=UPI0036CD52A6
MIRDLDGIGAFQELRVLHLPASAVADLTPLTELPSRVRCVERCLVRHASAVYSNRRRPTLRRSVQRARHRHLKTGRHSLERTPPIGKRNSAVD